MSPSSPAWTVLGALLGTGAVAVLLRRSQQGGPAYRWFAAAALAWGAAFVAQLASVGSVTPDAIQLSLTDLLALVGLPPFAIGMFRLAPTGRGPATIARLTDGCLTSLGIFGIAWIAILRAAYGATAVGAGSFAVELIHPLADLLIIGITMPVALRAGRAALAPYLAMCALTLGDLLAVQARAADVHAGGWAQAAWLAAICLLGAAGLAPEQPAPAEAARDSAARDNAARDGVARDTAARDGAARDGAGRAAAGSDRAARDRAARATAGTVIGLATAAAAALTTLIFAVATWGNSGPAPLIVCCALSLALAVRGAGLLRGVLVLRRLAVASGSKFGQLAERTSDVVLLCDDAGLVTYASKAVSRYGYAPAELSGRRLSDLVHPDDQANAKRSAAAAATTAQPESLACRVRAADGTWRHVQATLSLQAEADSQHALLVTARDVSDQVALRQQVTHLTFHDGLTGLPNRAYLEERTKDLLTRLPGAEGPEQAAAIFADLDGFTAINDSVGHGAGDLLLAQAGRRLRGLVPPHVTVARWGGDEFAILVEQASGPQEIVDIAERLGRAVAAEPFQVADRDVTITASLGVAFAGSDAAEHLLRNADLAMARAKEAGGGRVEIFAAHMHANVIRRLELTTDLRQAITDGALEVEYQPLVELATSRVAGVEALVRWTRAGDPVAPAEFLSIAEESGLIVTLGDWVLREACAQVAHWRESGWQVGLSVNFSLRQVSAPRFADSVLAMLDEAGLPRSALTLEITERVLINAAAPMIDELARLRQLGVRLAIDDFGTGYASLAYLRELPVDIIKIDPSFVAGLGADGTLAMLTRTIVQVGHDLGIEIVAEGIERPEQLELLRAMGCGLGQGYLVARPMTAQGIESLSLANGRRAVAAPGGPPGLTPARPPFSAADDTGVAGSDSGAAAAAPAG
jgi:diguanylate cyclase (GGDEF)-like protein/PAS domain S-box-containing protein